MSAFVIWRFTLQNKAIILLSGGIDSATALAIATDRGYETYALTVDYGQRHKIELSSADLMAKHFKVCRHITLKLDLRAFGGSALTDNIEIPKGEPFSVNDFNIPSTYVPARNTIMLSMALSWSEVLGARHIFIGANAVDYSGYPDCRPEFIESFQSLANLATKDGVEGRHFTIEAPLISMSKAQIIQLGIKLGVDYSMTHSCYDPSKEGLSCGSCDSCLIRKNGFIEANYPDPTTYINKNG